MNNEVSNSSNKQFTNILMQSVFAGVIGLFVSLIAIIILAIVLYYNPMGEGKVYIISQIIKYACAIIVAVVACLKRKSKGFIRGFVGAMTYILLGFAIYNIFGFHNGAASMFFTDVIICSVLGLLTGAVVINMNAKRR